MEEELGLIRLYRREGDGRHLWRGGGGVVHRGKVSVNMDMDIVAVQKGVCDRGEGWGSKECSSNMTVWGRRDG